MIGITDYIRNDLEGVYTAELFRGTVSMFLAVILTQLVALGEARAYILIVALNGLRSMTGETLPRRLFNIMVSLMLLVGTIGLSIWYGHNHLYIPQIITCIILSDVCCCFFLGMVVRCVNLTISTHLIHLAAVPNLAHKDDVGLWSETFKVLCHN